MGHRQAKKHLHGPSFVSLKRAFKVWIERIVLQRVAKDEEKLEYDNLEDIESMLAERMDRWRIAVKQEGRQEGREEGRQEGLIRGRKEALIKVFHKRFGLGAYEYRLENATMDQLDLWLDRALDAQRIEEVFE
jgi:flagellar biosynthesis/type III secretory pathway protein FliH